MTPVRTKRGTKVHVSANLTALLCSPTAPRPLIVSPDAVPDCKACLRALLAR